MESSSTSEVETLAALRESVDRHRRLVELAPDGIVIHQRGRLTFANPAAARILGTTDRTELVGRTLLDFIHPVHRELVALRIEQIENGNAEPDTLELKLLRLDGSVIEVEASSIPMLLHGHPAEQNIIRDITERKRGQEQLLAAMQQAQEALRTREEFLSVAAHELKTPVTGLWAAAQVIQRFMGPGQPFDQARLGRMLEIVTTQSEKLTRLVNRLLDISRLESGRLSLDLQWFDLAGLCTAILMSLQQEGMHQQVTVQVPTTLWLMADPLRVEQIIVNLIDNAVKYSPEGSRIRLELQQPTEGTAELRVTDEGPGVAADDQTRIFDRFYQAQAAERSSGLGLGLYISREIALQHGGQLHYEAASHGGSTFVLTLPIRGPGDGHAPPNATPRLPHSH
jgi:PAS domain S-box-containing protein